jgi:hypothetical protein
MPDFVIHFTNSLPNPKNPEPAATEDHYKYSFRGELSEAIDEAKELGWQKHLCEFKVWITSKNSQMVFPEVAQSMSQKFIAQTKNLAKSTFRIIKSLSKKLKERRMVF